MRHWRNLICFLFGVVLAAYGVFAFAETKPAVTVWKIWGGYASTVSAMDSCNKYQAAWPYQSGGQTIVKCGANYVSGSTCMTPQKYSTSSTCNYVDATPITSSAGCEDSSWSLSGSTCTRPDCPAGQVRLSDGTCSAPCPGFFQTKQAGGACTCDASQLNSVRWGVNWYSGTGDMPSTVCDGGCSRESGFGLGGGGKWMMEGRTWTGATCSETPAEAPAKPPVPNHRPKCLATEGVLTSSSGTVACVPAGTPDARVPAVNVQKKTETFPDNSTKTTETTTTVDPATRVKDVQTTVISSGGQAGPAGTVTVSESSGSGASGTGSGSSGAGSGTEGGGDGACDPKSDFCGGPATGGLYDKKSKTVSGVVGDFKSGLMGSGIGAAATGFFNVSVPGGACPNWVVNVAYLNTSLDLSQYFCTATAISMMNLVGAVLLFVAGFVGFRWAIL